MISVPSSGPTRMAYAADEIDDQRLHRHADAEHRFRRHHEKHLRVDDAKRDPRPRR